MIVLPVCTFGQKIAYIIPDIGVKGENTYVEIIAPHNAFGKFGKDGIYLNNPGDPVQVKCTRPADSQKIVIGPCVVSWNGRMISTQIFVLPGIKEPNSWKWYELAPEFRIPIHVEVSGKTSNSDTFYLLQPTPTIYAGDSRSIGSGGDRGIRSRRGAMWVYGLSVYPGLVSFSMNDCDPYSPGNQGYLPVTLLSKGMIRVQANGTLNVGANANDGGPGGGGGGNGLQCNTRGGHGFCAGGGNDIWYSGCSSSMPSGTGTGGENGFSLNSLPGGSSSPTNEGGGGGTGHPFGRSGTDGKYIGVPIPGTGGGTGGWQRIGDCGGGGGGFGKPGSRGGINTGGFVVGNRQCVPVSGGSGGGGGNVCRREISASSGGGGGGACILYGATIDIKGDVYADGGISGTAYNGEGHGGGGSGGLIVLQSKSVIPGGLLKTCGGSGGGVPGSLEQGGQGGSGRVRVDGELSFTNTPCAGSFYKGPTIDNTPAPRHSFTLSGTGNGDPIVLYLKSYGKPWQILDSQITYINATHWQKSLSLLCADTLFFILAGQKVNNPKNDSFTSEPQLVFSQAAAAIMQVPPGQMPDITLSNDTAVCKGESVQLYASGGTKYVWQPATGLNSATISNLVATPEKTTKYTVYVSDLNGDCVAAKNVTIHVNRGSYVLSSDTTICIGAAVSISIQNADSFHWGDGAKSNTLSLRPQKDTLLWVVAYDSVCKFTDTVHIKVSDRPTASFFADTTWGFIGLETAFMNQSTGATRFHWSFGDGSSDTFRSAIHRYSRPGKYTVDLIAYNKYGCSDTSTFAPIIVEDSFTLFAPDVFSPNGDGINDLFAFKSTGVETVSYFIFNRWGELIFRSENNSPYAWDGTFKGKPSPEGVYNYCVEASLYSGRRIHRCGHMILMR